MDISPEDIIIILLIVWIIVSPNVHTRILAGAALLVFIIKIPPIHSKWLPKWRTRPPQSHVQPKFKSVAPDSEPPSVPELEAESKSESFGGGNPPYLEEIQQYFDQPKSEGGDDGIAKRMQYTGTMGKRAADIRTRYDKYSSMHLFSEELRDGENRDWWENSDYETVF